MIDWQSVMNGVGFLAAAAAGYLIKDRQRIEAIEKMMLQKVEKADFERQANAIEELQRSTHSINIQLNTLTLQTSRLVSDAESEKETRKRTTEAILEKLDNITRSVDQRAARKRHDNGSG